MITHQAHARLHGQHTNGLHAAPTHTMLNVTLPRQTASRCSSTCKVLAGQQEPIRTMPGSEANAGTLVSAAITKRQLLSIGCACCLSLQLQQDLPAAADTGHFAYGGAEGPSHWPGMCSSGLQQSPINITLTGTGCDSREPPTFRYTPSSTAVVTNTGTTLQVNMAPGSCTAEWAGQQLELLQYHFHTPSEHALQGERTAMEAHLVHRNTQTGGLAVLAVLLEADSPWDQQQDQQQQAQQAAPNPCLAAGLSSVPATPGDTAPCSSTVNPEDLLPRGAAARQAYVAYRGSLTTPPCSEGVEWLVWTTPLVVPRQQVEAFRRFASMNARPLQPLNERALAYSCLSTA